MTNPKRPFDEAVSLLREQVKLDAAELRASSARVKARIRGQPAQDPPPSSLSGHGKPSKPSL